MKLVYALLTTLTLISSALAEDKGPFHFDFEEVSEGVWVGVRPDGPRFPVMGNATFVISDAGVVVFDGGGMPAMAELIIEKVRSLTDLPVTHVVISHWHGDHNFGIYRFAEEFPNVQFVAQSFTDRAMNGSPVDYIKNYATFGETRIPQYRERLETGKHPDGNDVSEHDMQAYRQMVEDADILGPEFKRARLTLPTLVFDDALTIHSGNRTIELLFLGHGNTEGDIVMWLAEEKIVAVGDLVVLPSPYAFNVPPRAWADTLRALNKLEYEVLVPGHGPTQRDTAYVDLIIAVADDIADQRDIMVKDGVSTDDIPERLDFSAWEEQFTGGDTYIKGYYDDWFEEPFRSAAVKELSGEPMKEIGPREASE